MRRAPTPHPVSKPPQSLPLYESRLDSSVLHRFSLTTHLRVSTGPPGTTSDRRSCVESPIFLGKSLCHLWFRKFHRPSSTGTLVAGDSLTWFVLSLTPGFCDRGPSRRPSRSSTVLRPGRSPEVRTWLRRGPSRPSNRSVPSSARVFRVQETEDPTKRRYFRRSRCKTQNKRMILVVVFLSYCYRKG